MTQETAAILQGAGWACACRGPTPIKGKGTLITYFVYPPYDAYSFSAHSIRPEDGALLRQPPTGGCTETTPRVLGTSIDCSEKEQSLPNPQPPSDQFPISFHGNNNEIPVSCHKAVKKVVVSIKNVKDFSVTNNLVEEEDGKRNPSDVSYTSFTSNARQLPQSCISIISTSSSSTSTSSPSFVSISQATKWREDDRRDVKSETMETAAVSGCVNFKNKSESLPLISCQPQPSSSAVHPRSIPMSSSSPQFSLSSYSPLPLQSVKIDETQDEEKVNRSKTLTKSGGLHSLRKIENHALKNKYGDLEEGNTFVTYQRFKDKCDVSTGRTSSNVESCPSDKVNGKSFLHASVSHSSIQTTLEENTKTSNYERTLDNSIRTNHILSLRKELQDENKSREKSASALDSLYISSSTEDNAPLSFAMLHTDDKIEKKCVVKEISVNCEKNTDRTTGRTLGTHIPNTGAGKVSTPLKKEYKVIHFTSSGLMRKKNQVFV